MSAEAAERMATIKKVEMAEAAERLLAGAGWLPALGREIFGRAADRRTAERYL